MNNEDTQKLRAFDLGAIKDRVVSVYRSGRSPVNRNTFKEITDDTVAITKRLNEGEAVEKTDIDNLMAKMIMTATYCRSAANVVPDNVLVRLATKDAKGDSIRIADGYEQLVQKMIDDLADPKKYTLMNCSYTKVMKNEI